MNIKLTSGKYTIEVTNVNVEDLGDITLPQFVCRLVCELRDMIKNNTRWWPR